MENLKALRIELGLTQKQVSEGLGMTAQQYGRIENGKHLPRSKGKKAIFDYFLSLDVVLKGGEDFYGNAYRLSLEEGVYSSNFSNVEEELALKELEFLFNNLQIKGTSLKKILITEDVLNGEDLEMIAERFNLSVRSVQNISDVLKKNFLEKNKSAYLEK